MYVIAEAAQGYEGSLDTCRLLVRAAAAGGADAVKFQLVFADDLAEPDYVYYDLFQSLEMPVEAWMDVAAESRACGVDLVLDVFGPRGLTAARRVAPAGLKLHSTTFFDDDTVSGAMALARDLDARLYLSIGGIDVREVLAFLDGLDTHTKNRMTILYGYQAEPTPVEHNNLARIPLMRAQTGLDIGFMDHSDGGGPDWLSLSTCAVGLGARVFEKHITLDRALEMEDYVSALAPSRFRDYSAALRRLEAAVGSGDLALTASETGYRNKALKKILAQRDMAAGESVTRADIRFNRPGGDPKDAYYAPGDVIGRRLARPIAAGAAFVPLDFQGE